MKCDWTENPGLHDCGKCENDAVAGVLFGKPCASLYRYCSKHMEIIKKTSPDSSLNIKILSEDQFKAFQPEDVEV